MTKPKPKKPSPTTGKLYSGRLDHPEDCPSLVINVPPICTADQWAAMGRPKLSIRYGLSYGTELYGYAYTWTWLRPCENICLRLVGPSNLLTVDVGIVNTAGEAWFPVLFAREGDPVAAADLVAGMVVAWHPIYYWDHSLTADLVARYETPKGDIDIWPQMDGKGEQPESPAVVLDVAASDLHRLADDGNPHAGDH